MIIGQANSLFAHAILQYLARVERNCSSVRKDCMWNDSFYYWLFCTICRLVIGINHVNDNMFLGFLKTFQRSPSQMCTKQDSLRFLINHFPALPGATLRVKWRPHIPIPRATFRVNWSWIISYKPGQGVTPHIIPMVSLWPEFSRITKFSKLLFSNEFLDLVIGLHQLIDFP